MAGNTSVAIIIKYWPPFTRILQSITHITLNWSSYLSYLTPSRELLIFFMPNWAGKMLSKFARALLVQSIVTKISHYNYCTILNRKTKIHYLTNGTSKWNGLTSLLCCIGHACLCTRDVYVEPRYLLASNFLNISILLSLINWHKSK